MPERAYRWAEVPHLAKRTLWSLRKPVPEADDEQWLLGLLKPAEARLYGSMAAVDRAHAIACARAVEGLGAEAVVASAMHDVGKTDAGLGTPGRVGASLCGLLIYDRAFGWRERKGLRGRIGRYLDHSGRGAAALAAAGAAPLTVAWAREHHVAPEDRTIDPALAEALGLADD